MAVETEIKGVIKSQEVVTHTWVESRKPKGVKKLSVKCIISSGTESAWITGHMCLLSSNDSRNHFIKFQAEETL